MLNKTNADLHETSSSSNTYICGQSKTHNAIKVRQYLFWIWFLILNWNFSLTSSFCPPLCSCNDVTLSVDCHEAGNLRMVPIFLNPQTKYLSLAQNQINEISMSFQFYSELTYLDFSQNKIELIGTNNFENLLNLRVLNASFNGITGIYDDSFLGLKNLQVLDLSVNQIEKVDGKVLTQLKNLKELYLDRNRLDSLEWDLFKGLEKLEKLSAKYNFLRIIEPPTSITITTSRRRQSLRRTSNNSYNKNNKLEESQHYANEAEGDNDDDHEETEELISSSWTLNNVKELDISWNQLTRVKNYGLSVFSSLKSINLCCNYIHTLEEKAFVPFSSSSSPLSESDVHSQLIFVNLSQNRLGRIPTNSLEKIESLIELDLSSNGISDTLPSHSFRGLFQLQRLYLNDNPSIISIDPDALIDNINLVEFEGNHLSNLTEFQVGLFNNKPYLEKFSLQFTQISFLPSELFQNPQYSSLVSTLSLLGAPLDCNCSSYPLFSWITQQQQQTETFTSSSTKNNNMNNKYLSNNNNNNKTNIINSSRNINNNDSSSSATSRIPIEKNNTSSTKKRKTDMSADQLLLHHHQTQLNLKSQQQKPQQQQQLVMKNKRNTGRRKIPPPPLLVEQLICMSPPRLYGIPLKDLNSATDFENCFDHFPLLFSSEGFEILVIIIASIIIVIILIILAIKLCCGGHQYCAKCTLKLKNCRRRNSNCSASSNNCNNANNIISRKGGKDVNGPCNGVVGGGGGGMTIMSVDEFCSNFNNSTKSMMCHEYVGIGAPVSSELVSKLKKTVHLTANNSNASVNSSSFSSPVGLQENNGLHSLNLGTSTLNANSNNINANRYTNTNGHCHPNNSSNTLLLRNNHNGHSLSTMTTGLSSSACSPVEEDDYDYQNDEDEDEEDVDEDQIDDEQDNYNNHHYRLAAQRQQKLKKAQILNYPIMSKSSYTQSTNNKLRFDPKIQLSYNNIASSSTSSPINNGTIKNDKRLTNSAITLAHNNPHHPLHPYHHPQAQQHHYQGISSSQHPALPSTPPPPAPGMILHYEYDYPEFINGKPTTSNSNHPQYRHHSHHGTTTTARIKQVPSVLV